MVLAQAPRVCPCPRLVIHVGFRDAIHIASVLYLILSPAVHVSIMMFFLDGVRRDYLMRAIPSCAGHPNTCSMAHAVGVQYALCDMNTSFRFHNGIQERRFATRIEHLFDPRLDFPPPPSPRLTPRRRRSLVRTTHLRAPATSIGDSYPSGDIFLRCNRASSQWSDLICAACDSQGRKPP